MAFENINAQGGTLKRVFDNQAAGSEAITLYSAGDKYVFVMRPWMAPD